MSHKKADIEQFIQELNGRFTQHRLRLNLNKTDILSTDPNAIDSNTISSSGLLRTDRLMYLESMLSANSEQHYEIASRINTTWIQ